jgi:hypothetical protein
MQSALFITVSGNEAPAGAEVDAIASIRRLLLQTNSLPIDMPAFIFAGYPPKYPAHRQGN